MDKRIVIVGAGAAGIAAATKLISHGFSNVIILEAENRIGGRINTIPFANNTVDMGAQWCHGEKDNVVFELAKDKDLLSSNSPNYLTFQLIQSDGTVIPQDVSNKLTSLGFAITETNEEQKRLYDGSLGNYFMEKYQEELKDSLYDDVDDELRHQFFDWFHKYENSIEASDSWYETSCRSLPEYWICEGDHLLNWRDKGYVTLFDLLQKRIPHVDSNSIDITQNVHFNREVSKIVYNRRNALHPVHIECSDGSAYNADHLICTVSLGVLKERYLNLFEPMLPQKKRLAIEGLTLGTVDKIFIEFDKPFWDEGWEGFSLLWKADELKQIHADRKFNWLEDIFGFYPINFQPNILCGWISGSNARRMEQASDEDVKKGCIRLLRLFLKQWNIPEPKNLVRSKWYSNPHFRGSYTFYSLKSDALGATTTNLAEPINDVSGRPLIQFGGEATNLHYYSTVHGAVGSGWREADRLIALYRIKAQL